MRWNLTVTYVPGKHLGGTDALSRYGIRSHNDAMVNNVAWGENSTDESTHTSLLFLLADKDSKSSDWEEHSLSALNTSHLPVTPTDIVMKTDEDR